MQSERTPALRPPPPPEERLCSPGCGGMFERAAPHRRHEGARWQQQKRKKPHPNPRRARPAERGMSPPRRRPAWTLLLRPPPPRMPRMRAREPSSKRARRLQVMFQRGEPRPLQALNIRPLLPRIRPRKENCCAPRTPARTCPSDQSRGNAHLSPAPQPPPQTGPWTGRCSSSGTSEARGHATVERAPPTPRPPRKTGPRAGRRSSGSREASVRAPVERGTCPFRRCKRANILRRPPTRTMAFECKGEREEPRRAAH